ncbi:MAG: DUF2071 domain-containing protein [Bacteroidota bacterium]
MQLLKRHPFAVAAYFKQSLVLTFALPREVLAPHLPPPLQLDTLRDEYAFVAVALVQTRHLRPRLFPPWLGNDFFLAGYRIFVRYQNAVGKRLRGLYILESQTDKRRMKLLGNLMTHYNYSRIAVEQERTEDRYRVHSPTTGLRCSVRYADDPPLPPDSSFTDWKEARRYAGPLPFTFTYLVKEDSVLIVEGVRQNWTPRPVLVEDWALPWLTQRGFDGAILASAFVVENIPYYWKKGVLEKCRP